MAETPLPSAPEVKSTEGTETSVPVVSENADRPRLITKINQLMGRDVNPTQILREISEGEGTGGRHSADWRNVTERTGLARRTLTPEARAWYGEHREEIQGMYKTLAEGRDLSRRESFQNLAQAINDHREQAGFNLRKSLKDVQSSDEYRTEVGHALDEMTAEKGSPLTVREVARIKSDVLMDMLEARKADAQEQVNAKATEQQAEKARAEAQRGEMLSDPLFQQKQNEIFEERGYDPDTVTAEQLESVQQEASDRYTQEKQAKAREHEDRARHDPSYRTELLKLVNAGISLEDARTQALEFAKIKIDRDDQKASEAKIIKDAEDAVEAEKATAAGAAERQKIVGQPGFKEMLADEMKQLTESGESLTPENVAAARDRAVERYKSEESAMKAEARNSAEYHDILASLLADKEDLTGDTLKELQSKALDQAVVALKAKEAQEKAAAEKAAAHAEQTPEDVLNGLGIDITSETGKSLLDAMKADPESAKAVTEKVLQAKDFQKQAMEAADKLGIKIDAQVIFNNALKGIVEQFNADPANVSEADGKIKKLLLLLLAGLGGIVVAGATSAVAASGEAVHRVHRAPRSRPH